MAFRLFVYVKLFPGRFQIRQCAPKNPQIDRTIDSEALCHPRSILGSIDQFSDDLNTALKDIGAFRFSFVKPNGLLHFVEPVDGGYTQAELFGVREAAKIAGIKNPLMLDSVEPALSDAQISEVMNS